MISNAASSQDRIVVIAAVDRSPVSEDVRHTAAALAQGLAGAELHVLHVIENVPAPGSRGESATGVVEAAREFLELITRRAAESFRGRIGGHLAFGEPHREILQLAANLHADLIVVGSHGKNLLDRMIVGSTSEKVVRKSQCAVLVAKRKNYISDVPEIEPPCSHCLEVQRETGGVTLWCTRHSTHHVHGHLHYETPSSFGVGSSFIRPQD